MELRTAKKEDLPALEMMFKNIVEVMYKNGITIWNECYPYEEFAGDIENKSLYLITDGDEIAAAFGVYNAVNGQDCFEWKDNAAKAVYLSRVGVNVKFLRRGIGKLVLKHALEMAKLQNAKFLRLLVSDVNKPAINLYRKSGFKQAIGVYNEFSESLNKNIVELGFETEG
ncbi:MAG: GNAT family N-acetyltransferase [Alphaproteobacteria bacterium]|nr:GNAT family N-acetyltransferase [Alphaproteobacteria bacterium]